MLLKDAHINKEALKEIKKNIQKHSPFPNKVKIIAVTKTLSYQSIQNAVFNNIYNIGENKIQEAYEKTKNKKKNPKNKLHFIGHLQSNKAAKAVGLFDVIHSVDSIKLLNKINSQADKQNKKQKVFLQINISKSKTQSGFKEDEIYKAAEKATQKENIKLMGVMCIATNTKDRKTIDSNFIEAKKIKEKIQKNINPHSQDLSMGMSQDYILALKNGATYIRIGTKLFGKRNG